MGATPPDSSIPRGALIVVAVGLLACLAAAVLATDKSSGAAAQLEWVQKKPLPDSAAAPVPGGGGEMRLTEAGIRATGVNTSGYSLYRVAAVLKIDAGSPIGRAHVLCSMKAPARTEVAQTEGSRASYPRSSEELIKQGVTDVVLVEFNSLGTGLAVVEFGDAFEIADNGEAFANERGIKLKWPTYQVGRERWKWFLPPGRPTETLELGFASIWRTTAIPAAKITCTLTASGAEATVRTAGALSERSEPISEDE